MSTSRATGVSKTSADKNQRVLLELVSQPGNDVCADCKAKAPRWASHNLGIFICVHCASIHRKIGTHVTKVKSLTLDDWSREQVENMKSIGNVRANHYWNPDETKHPLPTNMEESERDSELEKYIRSKYEFQRFRSRSALVAEKLGPSQSIKSRTPLPSSHTQSTVASLPKRSQTAPIRSEPLSNSSNAPSTARHPPLPNAPALEGRSVSSGSGSGSSISGIGIPPRRSSFNPFPSAGSMSTATTPSAWAQTPANPPSNQQASLTSSTFNDLISLQAPTLNSSLPLQYSQASEQQTASQPFHSAMPNGLNQTPTSAFMSTPFGASTSAPTNSYASLPMTQTMQGTPFSSPNQDTSFRSASLPLPTFGQSPLSSVPTGSPNTYQQPFNPSSNPFTQMQSQAQTQQYHASPLASSSPMGGQSSPFFSPQQQQAQQQQLFQPGVFQPSPNASSPFATQAQQLFQGMSPGGAGTSNPFTQWGGS